MHSFKQAFECQELRFTHFTSSYAPISKRNLHNFESQSLLNVVLPFSYITLRSALHFLPYQINSLAGKVWFVGLFLILQRQSAIICRRNTSTFRLMNKLALDRILASENGNSWCHCM